MVAEPVANGDVSRMDDTEYLVDVKPRLDDAVDESIHKQKFSMKTVSNYHIPYFRWDYVIEAYTHSPKVIQYLITNLNTELRSKGF